MKLVLKLISLIGLLLTIVPSILVFQEKITLKQNFTLMIFGLVLWFGTAPFWMRSKSLEEESEDKN